MGLRVCPNCGNSYMESEQDVSRECKTCGFKLNTPDDSSQIPPERTKNTVSKKRLAFFIGLTVVIGIALYFTAINIHRQNTLHKIEALVKEGKYSDAYSLVDSKIYESYSDNEAVKIAWEIGNLEWKYAFAREHSYNKIDFYTSVVIASIGCHQQLLDWGLYDYILKPGRSVRSFEFVYWTHRRITRDIVCAVWLPS